MIGILLIVRGTSGPAADLAPLQATEIKPGIHVLSIPADFRGSVIGNVTVVEQSDGVALIDSGANAADGRRIVSFVRTTTPKPVKAVLITHWHNDHPLGLSAIRKAWPNARIISTPATARSLRKRASKFAPIGKPDPRLDAEAVKAFSVLIADHEAKARDPNSSSDKRAGHLKAASDLRIQMTDYEGSFLVLPSEHFEKTLIIDDETTPVHFLFLGRANTNGDAIAWIPSQRVLVAGDIVVAPSPFGLSGYTSEWIGVLQQLKKFDFDVLVPGHGQPQNDTKYLDKLIVGLVDLRTQVAELASQGLCMEQVKAKLDFSRQRQLFGEQPRLERYWLRPLPEIIYKELKGEPISQDDH